MTDPSGTMPTRDLFDEGRDLMAPHSRLGVPVPAYRGRSLANVASTLWTALAPSRERDGPSLPSLEGDLDPFRGRRPEGSVVLLLVDGLGWRALVGAAERTPDGAASRWLRHARPLTSVFPTTTTVALTSLATGAAPAQHGVTGHRVFLPRFGSVVEVLRMSPLGVSPAESLVGPEWSPSLVSGLPTIFRRGIPTAVLSRDRFEGTGFSRLIYDGAAFVGFSTGSDFALSLVDVLSQPEPPPFVLAYRDDLDVTQHKRGVRPELIDLELDHVDAVLSFAARHLPPETVRRTTFLITGDHGLVPMEADKQLVVDRDRELLAHLSRPPAGDRRSAYFTARPGHLGPLREALEARLPPGGKVLDLAAGVEAGLFGPPPFHPELSERLGDLLQLSPSPGGVSYTVPGGRARPDRMVAAHGGLEPDELLVPWVSGTLEDLVATTRPIPRPRRARGAKGPS